MASFLEQFTPLPDLNLLHWAQGDGARIRGETSVVIGHGPVPGDCTLSNDSVEQNYSDNNQNIEPWDLSQLTAEVLLYTEVGNGKIYQDLSRYIKCYPSYVTSLEFRS